MAAITIAPRLEDPTSDIESVVTGGTVQIRISAPVSTGGQWLLPIWSPVIPIEGVPVVVLLDPNATVAYEARFRLPSGEGAGDYLQFTEFRKVVDATPRAWDTLEQVGAPGSAAAIPSDITARLTSLEATVAGISGGASTITAITDMPAYMKDVNTSTNATTALTKLTAAPAASPTFTGTATIPTANVTTLTVATTATVPTATAGDATTKAASTAFVDTSFAKKASPTFTGTVIVPTASNAGSPVTKAQLDAIAGVSGSVDPVNSNIVILTVA